MDINQIIDHIGKLPEASKNTLKEIISEVTYPKGHILFKADKVETKVYFIKKGIVRARRRHSSFNEKLCIQPKRL